MVEIKELAGPAGAIILPNIGGWMGGLITRKNIDPWYKGLNKPEWRPPNWAFGPVWTGIYSSIGYASYVVYKEGGGFSGPAKYPLVLYGTNLALNWAWTPLFFGAHKIRWALYEMQLLNITTIGTAILFYKVNKNAGLLFIPYLLWMGLATTLNYCVVRDNPEVD